MDTCGPGILSCTCCPAVPAGWLFLTNRERSGWRGDNPLEKLSLLWNQEIHQEILLRDVIFGKPIEEEWNQIKPVSFKKRPGCSLLQCHYGRDVKWWTLERNNVKPIERINKWLNESTYGCYSPRPLPPKSKHHNHKLLCVHGSLLHVFIGDDVVNDAILLVLCWEIKFLIKISGSVCVWSSMNHFTMSLRFPII